MQIRAVCVKKVSDTHGPQHFRKLRAALRLELRQSRFHRRFLFDLPRARERILAQPLHKVCHRQTLVRQQRHKAVTVRIRLDKSCRQIVLEVGVFRTVHHLRRLHTAVRRGKISVTYLIILVRRLPLAVKGQGVDQIQHGLRRNRLVQDFFDTSFGVCLAPLIDVLHRLFVKIRAENLCLEQLLHGRQKAFLYLQVRVVAQPDRICCIDLRPLPFGVQNLLKGFAGIKHFTSDSLLNLRRRYAVRAFLCHQQRGQHRSRREDKPTAALRCVSLVLVIAVRAALLRVSLLKQLDRKFLYAILPADRTPQYPLFIHIFVSHGGSFQFHCVGRQLSAVSRAAGRQ